jgi:phage terminase large subunit-like protein
MFNWSTACPDWERRLLAGRSLIPDHLPMFSESENRFKDVGEQALRIFKRLKVPDIEGNPTHGEVCGEWVFDLVRVIFGSYDTETKRRMIREFFMLIPKKNGKSSIAAAIMVVAVIMNRRPEAECLMIAPTKKIADIAYKQAAGIIRLDPELKKVFHPQQHQRTITHRITRAAIAIKAADTDVITGAKSTFILVDETHVFAKMSRAADVFVEIRGGLASRPEGFILQITTQSKEPPSGVFNAELGNARDVRDGKLVLPLMAILYEFPGEIVADEGWKDPKTWGLVNPNLNKSVDLAFLSDEMTKAEREGAAAMALFASQHLNIEIGMGLRSNRWPGSEYWVRRADKALTLRGLFKISDVIVPGVDGGGLDDLFGLSLLGRHKITKDWLLWTHAWCHKGVLVRRKSIATKLLDFQKAGDLTIVDDELEDISKIVRIIKTGEG